MKLYWLDLETTGLDPEYEVILEVSLSKAEFLDPFNAKHAYHAVTFLPLNAIRILDPFVLDMHTKNGLLTECQASTKTMHEVEQDLLSLVPWFDDDKEERPILAGSCINFDHQFIAKHWPELNKRFSYREYDVTALKLFCRSQGMPKIPKGEAHRAQADVEESITHAKLCKEWLATGWQHCQFKQGTH